MQYCGCVHAGVDGDEGGLILGLNTGLAAFGAISGFGDSPDGTSVPDTSGADALTADAGWEVTPAAGAAAFVF
jgi:hypothetical protein